MKKILRKVPSYSSPKKSNLDDWVSVVSFGGSGCITIIVNLIVAAAILVGSFMVIDIGIDYFSNK